MAKDLSHWLRANSYTLVEAALILVKQNPDSFPKGAELLANPPANFRPTYRELIEHANSGIYRTVTLDDISPNAVIIDDDDGEATIPSILTGFRLRTDREQQVGDITELDGFHIRVGKSDLQKWAEMQDVAAMDDKPPLYCHFYSQVNNAKHDISKELQQIKEEVDKQFPNEALKIPRGGKKIIKGILCRSMKEGLFETQWREGTKRGLFKMDSHEGYGKGKI